MSIQYKLSIIIPAFNVEKYIGRCLESLINQSLKDLEVIVVDDASTDSTSKVVDTFRRENPQIAYIRNKSNLGAGVSRNVGFSVAGGVYVAFLDADDWIDTNAYHRMVDRLDSTAADIAMCGIKTEYGGPFLSNVRYSYPIENLISGKFALKLLCRTDTQDVYVSPMPGNKIFRKSFLSDYNLLFSTQSLYEDDEFMFRALMYAKSVAFVPDVFQHYYQRETSAMHSFSFTHIDAFIHAFQSIQKHLTESHQFSLYEDEFYALFDKCLSSLFDTLFNCEQSIQAQRQYIAYLLEKIHTYFSVREIVDHIDPQRLHRLWE